MYTGVLAGCWSCQGTHIWQDNKLLHNKIIFPPSVLSLFKTCVLNLCRYVRGWERKKSSPVLPRGMLQLMVWGTQGNSKMQISCLQIYIYLPAEEKNPKDLISIRLFLSLGFFLLLSYVKFCIVVRPNWAILETNTAPKVSAAQCSLNAGSRCNLPLHTEISLAQTSNWGFIWILWAKSWLCWSWWELCH